MANVNGSLLRDFKLKDEDTKKRLGKVFAALIKIPNGVYFIAGGQERPGTYSNDNFGCVYVGGSSLDVNEGENIVRGIGSFISSTFSENDLHAMVLTDYASRIMQLSLEDIESPRGVAVEFLVVDWEEKVLSVRYDGNTEDQSFEEISDNIVLISAYDPTFRKILMGELRKAPTDVTSKNIKQKGEEIMKVALSIRKKLKLKYVSVLV